MQIFQKKYIPNYLTFFRVLATVGVVILLLLPFGKVIYSFSVAQQNYEFTLNYFLAGIIFLAGVLSDFLDGYLARKFNWISTLGKIWDPVTDKILINSTFIILSTLQIIPVWVTVIFIFRDTFVESYRMYAAQQGIVVPANLWGKLKTITQMLSVLIIFFLFNGSNNNWQYWTIQNIMVFIAVFFSLFSGVVYIYQITKNTKVTKKTKNKIKK